MTPLKIAEILLAVVIMYFGFLLFAWSAVFCILYYYGGGAKYSEKAFDFFANIMYPWR